MEYIIRACEEKDLPTVLEFCQRHANYEKAAYEPAGKLELLKAAIFTANPRLYCFVVDINGQLAGYFTYTFDFSTWDAQQFLYLDCLYLDSEFRGMRIGEKVFEELRAIAKHNKCVNIQWQTPDFNEGAIRFYKRIGGTGKSKERFFIDIKQ